MNTGRGRTLLLVRRNRAFRRLTSPGRNRERVVHTNSRDAENPISGPHVPLDACGQLVGAGGNVTRFQRAGKRAEQSTANRSDDVVERREHLLIRLDTIELLDGAVDAKPDRFAKRLDRGVPNRTLDSLDACAARVDMLGHLQHSRDHTCRAASLRLSR